jgi:prolyl oligopeptidase
MRRALLLLAACHGPTPVPTLPPSPPTPEPPVAQHPPGPAKDYPASRRDVVVDKLHGVDVADPYRWLEDAAKPEVAAWMTAQDDYARARLAKLPHRDEIAKRLAEVFYFDAISAPIHRGTRYFYSRKHKDKEKRIVYWKAGETGPEKVLLDPNTWSPDGSTGLHGMTPSWDGQYVAYQVSEHNADETAMKVLEVGNGKVLPDTIPGTKFGGASWAPDGKAFYYTFTPPASDAVPESQRQAHTEVRFHKLGTDPANDPVIYPATGHADWFLGADITQDGHWLLVAISHGSSGATSWFYRDARKPAKEWTTLVDGVDATSSLFTYKDRFYLLTNDGAPRYHVFAIDPAKPARASWQEIVKETDATLEGADIVGGQHELNYLRNAAS